MFQGKTYGFIEGLILFLFVILTLPAISQAEDTGPSDYPYRRWSTFLHGGYVYQLDTDMDNGGSFNVNRLFVQGGVSYAPDIRKSISLSLGYGYDGYDFSEKVGFGSLDPWKNINGFRISTPVIWGFGEKWTLFAIPTLRTTAESGADLDDGITGGGFAGFSYRFSDRLTIGPGIGALTQIEENATIFPVIIINWKITERLSLDTGRGLGATLGPGVTLSWRAFEKWNLSLGGRYEKLRFRLDDEGLAPRGVGEDSTFSLYGGATYAFSEKAQLALLIGADLGGELLLEDENGNTIVEEEYDPGIYMGFTFNLRF
jgi:hypothetical protein